MAQVARIRVFLGSMLRWVSSRTARHYQVAAPLILVLAALVPTLAEAADYLPVIVAPLEPWHAKSAGPYNCLGAADIDFVSDWEGADSPIDVLQQFVAAINGASLCLQFGNYWTRSYTLNPCVPEIHGIPPEGGLGISASGCEVRIHYEPKPDCLEGGFPCVPKNEDYQMIVPQKVCEKGQGTDFSGVGIYTKPAPSYGECRCATTHAFVPEAGHAQGHPGQCWPIQDDYHGGKSCPNFGNPIVPLMGFKRQAVDLGGLSAMNTRLSYDTRRMLPFEEPRVVYAHVAPWSFGSLWHSSWHRKLVLQSPVAGAIQAARGAGLWESFAKDGSGQYVPNLNVDDRLRTNWSWWILTDVRGLTQENYEPDGRLHSVYRSGGGSFGFDYSTDSTPPEVAPKRGLLIKVFDGFGRELRFNYEQPADLAVRIKEMIDVAGETTQFHYDDVGNLKEIVWPDLSVRKFVYEDANMRWALTGVFDENDARHATYGYDSVGRAISTEYAGAQNQYIASWSTAPRWLVSDTVDTVAKVVRRNHHWAAPQGTEVALPNGGSTKITVEDLLGSPHVSSQTQPGGSGCGINSAGFSYDGRGNVLSRLDFGEEEVDRHRTCYAYASVRNVETYRVEGFLESDVCPTDLATYQVSGNLPEKPQRKIATEWHPLWNLETRRAEPKRITTTIYNGEKDPPGTGGVVTCIDDNADPRLPDNSKIAVVCRRYEHATADETGNQGFAAAPVSTRTWNYRYNLYGQVTLETDPRGKQTKYDYYEDSTQFNGGTDEHTKFDLFKVTRAVGTLNQVTEYQHYDKRGLPLRIKHPNGSLELRAYHVRGWLTKVTLRPGDVAPTDSSRDQVTQYEYYPTGLLHIATQPDLSTTTYTWDAAHRLKFVADSGGNQVEYEHDNLGNVTAEKYKDPAGINGALAKTISRTFDALGRMKSVTGVQ